VILSYHCGQFSSIWVWVHISFLPSLKIDSIFIDDKNEMLTQTQIDENCPQWYGKITKYIHYTKLKFGTKKTSNNLKIKHENCVKHFHLITSLLWIERCSGFWWWWWRVGKKAKKFTKRWIWNVPFLYRQGP
jgi:hypothetical protein